MIRVVLIDLAHPHRHIDDAIKNLAELQSLVKTYGGIDVVKIIQHRTKPDKATFIGSGKVQELFSLIKKEKISIAIINSIVQPTQLNNLTQMLWQTNPNVQIWDRVDLMLNIFDRHAKSAEAKLQIEIARMRHMGHRIYGLGGTYFSRQGGGIGTRGIGQTNIERMKFHFKNQIKKKKEQLKKLEKIREQQLLRRKENGVQSISIVGYTNAGKTSLFNALTQKKQEVKDALFVTLDSVTGEVKNADRKTIVSDTIGFIHNLPCSLIDSFKSTLMQTLYSDIILHVIDAADKKLEHKINVVEEILNDLGIDSKRRIFVFNKIDQLNGVKEKVIRQLSQDYSHFSPLFISIKTKEGLEKLKSVFN